MGIASTAPAAQATPARPNWTPRASIAQAGPQAEAWVEQLAAEVFSEFRLGKLTEEHILTLAKLMRVTCAVCRNMVTLSEGRYFYGFTGTRDGRAWLKHMTIQHAARGFGVKPDTLRERARVILEDKLGQPETFSGDVQKAAQLSGWRTWKLGRKGNLFELQVPHWGNAKGEGVYSDEVQARHDGDRQLALQHMLSRATNWTMNPETLEISLHREHCTCGLYCWCDYEDFCTEGYRDFQNVSAQVIPFGHVQLGQDQKSLRASDMLIVRLEVYYGKLAIDGQVLANRLILDNGFGKGAGGWQEFLPVVDLVRPAYNQVCQLLADQFDVEVDLVMVNENQSARIVESNKIVLESFKGLTARINAGGLVPVDSLWSKEG